MAVTIDTIEGLADTGLWFHYDVGNDVLCIRLASRRESACVGEETEGGDTLLRDAATDEPIGLLVVSWWKRFGVGDLPDSMEALRRHLEPWAGKLAG